MPQHQKKKKGERSLQLKYSFNISHISRVLKILQTLIGYDILAHLRCIPTLLSVYNALQLSEELRRALILALLSPYVFKTEIDHIEGQPLSDKICASCLACITFSDEDLQLGKKFHNRPLYVKGTIGDAWVSRILLDYGSAVNLLPYKTLKAMGMKSRQLSPSNLTIQGFNQVGRRAMGTISLKVEIGELYSEALFHVIDADTSYNVLLGRPWIHTYGIIGSTLHQSFKFCDKDGYVKKVYADPDPFMGEEVNYADAKFYATTILMPSFKDNGIKKEGLDDEQDPRPSSTEVSKASKAIKVKVKSSGQTNMEENQGLKASKSKALFRYTPKSVRKPDQKILTPLQEPMAVLTASYSCPLRKIDQFVPRGQVTVMTNFEGNEGKSKRIVVFRRVHYYLRLHLLP